MEQLVPLHLLFEYPVDHDKLSLRAFFGRLRLFYLLRFLLDFSRIALGELLDAACRVEQLLLAGKERMAIGADFHMDIGLGRAGKYGIAARAENRTLAVLGMGILLH